MPGARSIWRDTRVDPVLVEVPMSGGHSLSAHRFPAPSGPAPAVVLFTPYRKESAWLTYADSTITESYEVFVVDTRATGGSTGSFEGTLSDAEVADAVELLAWVAAQPFCDGQTALIGSSYSGLVQYLIAARRPPSLRCIAPSIAPADSYRDMTHRGGIPCTMAWHTSTYGLSGRGDTTRLGLLEGVQESLEPCDNPRARGRSARPDVLADIAVPTLCLGGLYDLFTSATTDAFERLSVPKRLVLGNWGHETTMSNVETQELSRWLAFWLRNEGSDPTQGRNVRVHRAGDRTWHDLTGWPAVERADWWKVSLVEVPTHVPVAPLLEAVPPPVSTPMSDPSIDTAIDSGMRVWGEAWTTTTDEPDNPTDLLGPAVLTLDLAVSDCRDLDVHVRLSLVRADGQIDQVTEGRLRASHRSADRVRSRFDSDGGLAVPWRPHDVAAPLPVGKPFALIVATSPFSLRVMPGERLQVGITMVRADGSVDPEVAVVMPISRIALPLSTSFAEQRG